MQNLEITRTLESCRSLIDSVEKNATLKEKLFLSSFTDEMFDEGKILFYEVQRLFLSHYYDYKEFSGVVDQFLFLRHLVEESFSALLSIGRDKLNNHPYRNWLIPKKCQSKDFEIRKEVIRSCVSSILHDSEALGVMTREGFTSDRLLELLDDIDTLEKIWKKRGVNIKNRENRDEKLNDLVNFNKKLKKGINMVTHNEPRIAFLSARNTQQVGF